MLLDTTFVIDVMRDDEAAVEKTAELDEEGVRQWLSSMTLFELHYGIARSNQPDAERETVFEIVGSKPVYPADAAVMRMAGELAGELTNEGNTVADGDVIIGATAAIVEEPVLTRNVEDFERLDVDVEPY